MKIEMHRYQANSRILGVIGRRHPWIHRGALSSAIEAIPPSSLVRIVDGSNKFVTHAIYEPLGSIALRLLFTEDPFSAAQLEERLKRLMDVKKRFAKEEGGAYRLINGEADGFPGLVCDVYGTLAVWQPYLKFWDGFIPQFADEIESITGTADHMIKFPKQRKGDSVFLKGCKVDEPVIFHENGLKFGAFPLSGQKSGFFIDLKEVRLLLPSLVEGKSLLNCFANSGAFSMIALRYSASEVVSIDQAEASGGQFRMQMEANGMDADNVAWETAGVWEKLEEINESGKRFDIVILDPPNMCTAKASLKPALKGWKKLIRLGASILSPRGQLLAVNCSPFMKKELCEKEAVGIKPPLKISMSGGLPPDHTVTREFPEGNYLKWWLFEQV